MMFVVRTRVGLTPGAAEIFSPLISIRDLFEKIERLLKGVCDIDITFLIQDKDIVQWHIDEVNENEESFKNLYNERARIYLPQDSAEHKLLSMVCNLYYLLGTSDVDILVGLTEKFPLPLGMGIGQEDLKTCICSLELGEKALPFTLAHEILHLFGAKHSPDLLSIMTPQLDQNKLTLDEEVLFNDGYYRFDAGTRKKVISSLKKLRGSKKWYQISF